MEATPIPPTHDRYDVVVAGARVAGAATAMLLARRGMSVLVVDPAKKGSDTLSTHALMRGGVLQLRRWGLLDALRSASTPRIEKTTFHYGDESIPIRIEPRDGVDGLYAPRRTVLDAILVDAALRAGAHVVHGLAATELLHDRDGRVTGVRVRSSSGEAREIGAGLVIGADGMRSRIARLAGAATLYEIPHATASIYGYVPGLGIEGYEWFYGPGLGMGAIPTNAGETCIFASLAPERLLAERSRGLDVLFAEIVAALSPELWARIASRPTPPRLRAFAGAPSVLRQAWGPGWALVGDAAYFKDPLTAHGITDALRDAELLARAAVAGREHAFQEYQTTRDGLARGLMDVTGKIASLEWTLDELKQLHRRLSREMSAEVEVMLDWDGRPVAA